MYEMYIHSIKYNTRFQAHKAKNFQINNLGKNEKRQTEKEIAGKKKSKRKDRQI